MTTRRDVLRLFGLPAVAAIGAAACDAGRANGRQYVVDRAGMRGGVRPFVPVDVSAERHVRSTLGLRPYRNAGRLALE